jgi:predicted nucleic acid-binding protein
VRLLLDTSAYSAFMRGHEIVKLSLQRAEEILINPVILGELRAGFLAGKRKRKNEEELETFLSSSRVRIVAIAEETADTYAAIVVSLRAAGTPIPTKDIWIAASAMEHGARILTTDAHYQKVPQVVVERYLP